MEYSVAYIILNFTVMILGTFTHFAKKKITGQTLSDIKAYFQKNFKYTLITIIASIVTFISLITTSSLGIIASFGAGYISDSLFNKAGE